MKAYGMAMSGARKDSVRARLVSSSGSEWKKLPARRQCGRERTVNASLVPVPAATLAPRIRPRLSSRATMPARDAIELVAAR